MKSIFTEEAHHEILNRLNQLNQDSQPLWGKMNVGQTMAHCKFPLQVAMQELKLERPNALKRFLFSFFKSSLYNDKPWKQGLPTAPPFVVNDAKEFLTERAGLVKMISAFHGHADRTEWPEHPMFGKFTREQWGQMQYKHLDHHLKQFGV